MSHMRRTGRRARVLDAGGPINDSAPLACIKVSYPTPEAADIGALQWPHKTLFAYRCRECGKWHLSKSSGIPGK